MFAIFSGFRNDPSCMWWCIYFVDFSPTDLVVVDLVKQVHDATVREDATLGMPNPAPVA